MNRTVWMYIVTFNVMECVLNKIRVQKTQSTNRSALTHPHVAQC